MTVSQEEQLYVEFVVRRGFTYRRTIALYSDAARTQPLNLTGLNVRLKAGEWKNLTPGAGLTIVENKVTLELTPTDTETAPKERIYFVLEVENPEPTENDGPVHGVFIFESL